MSYRGQYESKEQRKKRLMIRRGTIIATGVVLVAAVVGIVWSIVGSFQPKPTPGNTPGVNTGNSQAASNVASTASGAPDTPVPSESDPASGNGDPVSPEGNLSGYQLLYPDLYAEQLPDGGQLKAPKEKTVYLTFDDGPSVLTQQLLDVLDQYGAKATFFNTAQGLTEDYKQLMKTCAEKGHAVEIHSYTHIYDQIYASVEAYLEDFHKMYLRIKEITGVAPRMFRFPGGSNEGGSVSETRKQIIGEMTRRGFLYYDWDSDSGDASTAANDASMIYELSMNQIRNDCNMLLMHNINGKEATIQALKRILPDAQAEGYKFVALDGTLDPTHGFCFSQDILLKALHDSPNFKLCKASQKQYDRLFGGGE